MISVASLCNKPSDSPSPPPPPLHTCTNSAPKPSLPPSLLTIISHSHHTPLFFCFAFAEKMKKPRRPPGITSLVAPLLSPLFFFFFFFFLFLFPSSLAGSQNSGDAAVMSKLKDSLGDPSTLGWSGSNFCSWNGVFCSPDGTRVTRIKISSKDVQGSLPPELADLDMLGTLEMDDNRLTGPVPDFSGSTSLTFINLANNRFTSIPPGFFSGLTGLTAVYLDNNPFQEWTIPPALNDLISLKNFSANNASITGSVPDFLFSGDSMTALNSLHLGFNRLRGPLPATSSRSFLASLWLNGQQGDFKLNGTITVLQSMTSLSEVWLQGNSFTGPIPDLSASPLRILNLRDNQMTGIVPASLSNISTLLNLALTNNLLQGPTPKFDTSSIAVDMKLGSNRFCLDDPGVGCDARIDKLLSAVQGFGYPANLANSWRGNNPCSSWSGITCDPDGKDIVVVNFYKMGLTGSISPNFASIISLQKLFLSNNDLTGTIPSELAHMPNLKVLDVSHNNLHGKVPSFNGATSVATDGNPDIDKESSGKNPGGGGGGLVVNGGKNFKIVGLVIGIVCLAVLSGVGFFLYCRKSKRYTKVQSPNTMVIHPRQEDSVKTCVAPNSSNTAGSNGATDMDGIETETSMVISIQVLKEATKNFSQDNILGRGGFGTVYKGEIHNGTKIAVKRMEPCAVSGKGLTEFSAEINVLTKVRHRHLVSLLGYCGDGNEKILVYEYMPQGTLSRFLFNWKAEGLYPLEWSRRLTIALDVARAVEYLHGLAHQSFIHRDLKPSNILLGDDMRAKVADFGLVRLAPEGQHSVSTRLAGTFGYMAPEYAVTGRVTIKVDVFSFGVILMELITGRRALDEREPEEKRHLVPWFRRMQNDDNKFHQVMDSSIEPNEETLASISTVADLAGHCTAREPYQRPDMSHVVNILSSLAELWKPVRSGDDDDELAVIVYSMTLNEMVEQWNNKGEEEVETCTVTVCPSNSECTKQEGEEDVETGSVCPSKSQSLQR